MVLVRRYIIYHDYDKSSHLCKTYNLQPTGKQCEFILRYVFYIELMEKPKKLCKEREFLIYICETACTIVLLIPIGYFCVQNSSA
jgi:hypothetical protein